MNANDASLELIFTSTDGTKFFSFKNPLSIPPARGLSAEKAKRFVDMNITDRSLRALLIEHKAAAKEGDLRKCFWIIQEIEFRLDMISEEKSLLELAAVYFMLENEDPRTPTNEHNKAKHKVFAEDSRARDFFLRTALSIVKRFSEKPEEDTLSYLEDSKVIAERIRRYIPEEHSINSTST